MPDCIRCQPTFPTHFIGACSTFTVLMHRAVITRRSISSRAPAVHQSERACYSVGVVFSTALLWLRGRRSFPSFLYDLPYPPSFESSSVIGSPLWQRDTRTHTIKVERGRIYPCHILKEEELIIHQGQENFSYISHHWIWNKQLYRIGFISCFSRSAFCFLSIFYVHLFSQRSPAQHALPDTFPDLRKWGKHENEPENVMNVNKDWLRNRSH